MTKKIWAGTLLCGLMLSSGAFAQELQLPDKVKVPVDTRFQNSPGAADFPGAKAVLLQDDIRFEAEPDGSTRFEEHDVIKVLNDRGVQEHKELFRVYRSGNEQIEVKRACTILPDGRVLEIPKQAIVDEPLFTDTDNAEYKKYRKFIIRYPLVQPGGIVEFHLVTRRQPLPERKWWGVTFVQNPDPMVESTFTVQVPAGSRVRYATPGLGNLPPQKTTEGAWDRYFWKVTRLSPYEGEPNAPSSLVSMHRIEVTNLESWAELRAWFDRSWVKAVEPDEKIRTTVARLFAADASPRARLEAVTAFVAKKRTTEIPSDDLQPRRAADLLSSDVLTHFDTATLTASMLQAAGLTVQAVLASQLPADIMNAQLPRANRIDQVLLRVNGQWWVDPQHVAELMDSPPSGFQGMGALEPEAAQFADLPVSHADQNRQETRIEARVDNDGRAEVLMSVTEYGSSGTIYREAGRELSKSGKDQREQALERLFDRIARNFSPRARVHDRYFSLGTKPGEPFDLSTTLTVPGFAAMGKERSRVPLPLQPNERMASLLSGDEPRKQPVQFPHPQRDEVRVHMILPPGSQVTELPPTVEVSSPYGSFFATSRSNGAEVWYYSRLILNTTWVPSEKVGELMNLAKQVLASQTAGVVFTRTASAGR